ncbi:ubinuclein-2-like [Apium graveolens]|uniref:ubinuclein-2-like n=1 Tax=Apium graveolens TaxID=4045 RepID=UPI003D7BFC42
MILEELYASQANCNNFKQIKMEFIKLIRLQASSSKLKVPAPGHTKGTYSMGYLLEEKLCDLYDTFIQGLDEDSGSSVVRRLFAKLADLWPEGTMDMHEIRQAICRAKERRVIPSTQ